MKNLFNKLRGKQLIPIEIPEYIERPLITNSTWNKIALGIGNDNQEIFIDLNVNPQILVTSHMGGGKSIIIKNVLAHCIEHSHTWRVIGLDILRVELHQYLKLSPVILGVSTSIEDILGSLRYVHKEMMTRFEQMEQYQVYSFRDLPHFPKALMIIVDETYLSFAQINKPPEHDFESIQAFNEENAMRKEALNLVAGIARLGRPSGIHMTLATQRPESEVLFGELKQNLSNRIVAGKVDEEHSQLSLDNDAATRLPDIKGRGYFQVFGKGQEFQSYFIDDKILRKISGCE